MHNAPPVSQSDFAQGHGANHQRSRLGSGVSAAADDQWNKQCQNGGGGDFLFKVPHCRCRQHFSQEKCSQPTATLPHHLQKTHFKIGAIQCFGTADLLNIFAGFFFDDVHDVVGGNDSLHVTGLVDDWNREKVFFAEELC